MMVTASERLTPRARAKRDQIRKAAQGLFLERGFYEASTDAIASAAGVSKETLYRYFPNKEALLADCLGSLISDLPMGDFLAPDGSRPIDSRHELRTALLGLADRYVEIFMQPVYTALLRVIIHETPRRPQLGDVFRSAVPENMNRRIANILKRAQEGNVAHVADTEAATRMFVGPLLTYVIVDGLLAGEGPPHRPPIDRIEAIVDVYLRAITSP